MKKLSKFLKKYYKDIIVNTLLITIYLIVYFLITKNNKYIYASKMDFMSQHYIIPDYLRKLFYSTHNLFPSFAFNIASGTNIYNLAYYGLLNPLIMLSYLFPKLSMLNYILVLMPIIVLSSASLFYFYLRKRNYTYSTSFTCAALLLCSSPFIFHSHRHIMFIDYMPFLILGLYGIDQYIKNKKSTLLIISVTLMIFTSYFFSVSGMSALFIYGIYRYIEEQKKRKIKFKELIMYMFNLSIRFIIPVLISSILILPTLYALITGRGDNNSLNILKKIFDIKLYLLYDHYSLGLTIISLVSIVYLIIKGNKANRFLAITILIFSVSVIPSYILNGFLYVNPKSLIPYIPITLILVSEFLMKVFSKVKYRRLIVLYLIISALLICIRVNKLDRLMKKEDIKKQEIPIYSEKVQKIIDSDNLYRINSSSLDLSYTNRVVNIDEYKTTSYLSSNNKYYKKFYKYKFENPLIYRNDLIINSSRNFLFETYMGEKYIFSKNKLDSVYKEIDNYGNVYIYENEYTLPIGYASNTYINKKNYNKLNYPTNAINMLGNIINDNKTNTDIKELENVSNQYKIVKMSNIKFEKQDDNKYVITSKNNGYMELETDDNYSNKIVFISFILDDNYKDKKNDLSIEINNIKNKLTYKKWKYYNNNRLFNYTIIDNSNKLHVKFNKGEYKIHDIEIKVYNIDEIKEIHNKIDPFIINKKETKGDIIKGMIDVNKDSYFTISIPYDKGFKIKVDNKITSYSKINDAFIGFPIKKGMHNITIEYKAPWRNIGILLSIIGIISFIIVVCYEYKKQKR